MRPEKVHLLAQVFGRPFRQVGIYALAHGVARPLEGHRQLFGVHLAQQELQGLVLQFDEILDGEQPLADVLGQMGVDLVDATEDYAFGIGIRPGQDFHQWLDGVTVYPETLARGGGDDPALEAVLDGPERLGAWRAQGGDAVGDITAQLLR